MTGKAGLKAGLIGGAIMLVVALLNQFLAVPGSVAYSLVSCGVISLMYAGIGVLAGFFVIAPRTAGRGAGAGAIAGLVSGVVASVVGLIAGAIEMTSGVDVSAIDSQQMEQLAELGLDPMLFLICFSPIGMGIAAGLGAIGGAILAAIKPD